jgi:predicted TIM-barrel enzyme
MGNPSSALLRDEEPVVVAGQGPAAGAFAGRIAASVAELEQYGLMAYPVLAPFIAGLPVAGLPATALLAIHDINGLLFEALTQFGAPCEGLVAAIFACDPLRGPDRIARQLMQHGITRVVAFPSIGAFDGRVRRDLEEYGFHHEAELAALARLRALGFETLAAAVDAAHLAACRRHGMDAVLIDAADIATPGPSDHRQRLLAYSPDGAGLVIREVVS